MFRKIYRLAIIIVSVALFGGWFFGNAIAVKAGMGSDFGCCYEGCVFDPGWDCSGFHGDYQNSDYYDSYGNSGDGHYDEGYDSYNNSYYDDGYDSSSYGGYYSEQPYYDRYYDYQSGFYGNTKGPSRSWLLPNSGISGLFVAIGLALAVLGARYIMVRRKKLKTHGFSGLENFYKNS